MATTNTRLYNGVQGNRRKTVTTVAFDSAIPTGGESVTATDLGLSKVESANTYFSTIATTTVNATNAIYNLSTNKVQVFDETPAEVANNADLAGCVVTVEAYGW
jgi:hypothetical protein